VSRFRGHFVKTVCGSAARDRHITGSPVRAHITRNSSPAHQSNDHVSCGQASPKARTQQKRPSLTSTACKTGRLRTPITSPALCSHCVHLRGESTPFSPVVRSRNSEDSRQDSDREYGFGRCSPIWSFFRRAGEGGGSRLRIWLPPRPRAINPVEACSFAALSTATKSHRSRGEPKSIISALRSLMGTLARAVRRRGAARQHSSVIKLSRGGRQRGLEV